MDSKAQNLNSSEVFRKNFLRVQARLCKNEIHLT